MTDAGAPAASPGTPVRLFGRVLALPGYGLFFLMLVFPMVIELLYVKATLFALLLGMSAFVSLRTGRIRIDPIIVLIALVMVTASQVFVLEGLAHGATAALQQAEVYVLFPLVYTLILPLTTDERVLRGLHRTVIVATIVAGVYAGLFVLTRLKLIPGFFFVGIFSQGEAIGLHQGYFAFSLYFLNGFFFLVPYVAATLLLPKPAYQGGARVWPWVALVVGLAASAVSGRRALWLVIALAPVFMMVLLPSLPTGRATLRRMAVAVPGVVLVGVGSFVFLRTAYHFDVGGVLQYVPRAFDAARQVQLHALVDGWADHWAFGSGLATRAPIGPLAAAAVRSETMPWAYELYYLALLFQTGVVGMTLYAAGVAWIFWMGIRVIRSGSRLGQLMFPALIGLACFLVATGTNPYLARFDGLWVLFFPLAIINCWLLECARRAEARAPAPIAHHSG
jgi:hypothetical protein